MFKKSYKGRRIKLAAKKSLAVPVAIVTSFIVILAVSLSTLINKGLVNAFSDSVTPTPSTTSTTADLVKSTEVSSSKDNKANKEKVEESKPQSETTGEAVEAAEKSQSDTATTASIDATFTQNNGAVFSVAASTAGNGSVILSNGNTAGEIGSYAAAQMAAATGVPQSTWESIIARESNGDHTVANSSGASGLFQTMPGWGSTATVEDQIQSALNAYNAQGLSAWNY